MKINDLNNQQSNFELISQTQGEQFANESLASDSRDLIKKPSDTRRKVFLFQKALDFQPTFLVGQKRSATPPAIIDNPIVDAILSVHPEDIKLDNHDDFLDSILSTTIETKEISPGVTLSIRKNISAKRK